MRMTSIRDIARRARVSIGTVDRVLHNRGRVSRKTEARIRRIIAAVEYTPNIYARNLSLGRSYEFAVLMPKPSQDSSYWRLPARGIVRAGDELKASRVRIRMVYFDRYSERSFERAARQCQQAAPDGILLAPVLPHVAARLVPDFFRCVPYVFFDSTIPDPRVLCCVSQDAFQSGYLAGQLMRMVLGKSGEVLIVRVLPDDIHINERIRGFEAAVRKEQAFALHLEETDSRDFGPVWRRLALEETLTTGLPLGVFVSNAWTHAVARHIHAYRRANRNVRVIGYDLVAENVRCLKQGSVDILISQRPALQGYLGIMALYRHLVLREKVRKHITVPLDILTKDNFTYYHEEQEAVG